MPVAGISLSCLRGNRMFTPTYYLEGVPVVVTPLLDFDTPKLKLSDSTPVSDSFRAQFNTYLKETFGTEQRAVWLDGVWFMPPEMYHRLRVKTKEYQVPKQYPRLNELK